MPTGRPQFRHRRSVVATLKSTQMTIDEIAENFGISRRTVYQIATEHNLNMALRSRVMRLIEEQKRIEDEINNLWKAFADD